MTKKRADRLVFILTLGEQYEGYIIMGVYAKENIALNAAKKYMEQTKLDWAGRSYMVDHVWNSGCDVLAVFPHKVAQE